MLGVNTPKGRVAEENIRKAILKTQTDNKKYAWFPDSNYFPIDGFIIKDHNITAIFEGKYRYAGLEDNKILFQGKLYDDYLVTANKLDDGIAMAKKMCIDFYLIVCLELSNVLLIFKVYEHKSGAVIPHERKNTRTRETVNGGSIVRENAYIKISSASIIKLQ